MTHIAAHYINWGEKGKPLKGKFEEGMISLGGVAVNRAMQG